MSPPALTPPTTPLSAKLLIIFSSILLAHSCYSAHEHTTLATSRIPPSSLSTSSNPITTPTTSLPLDIILETLISIALLCIGIVLSGWDLKPIQWHIWAGQLERETGQGPYAFLESRMGFVDIRAKRAEFSKWVKERDASHQ